ncbi:hypothetical protein P3T76_006848 [Phytophthora citrophthora]|uniref:Autophagy protein ATG17-like domain-containing protein n=1 Tax=Phytophthora citrophthora TaxID=4793 RepID=A0AAD9LP67_9STRA|nr:hypothetical protein P3T76_006848 [Phytophthora citrophthora]
MRVRAVEYFAVATREVAKTISEKCQVLGKMLDASRVKLHSAQQIAQNSVFAQKPLLQEMNCVFEQLQSSSVDPNMVGGECGKTLFDFIDAETVQSLQQDTLEQTKEVEELLAAHQHAITRITAIYAFFVTFDKAHGNDVNALVGEHRDLTSITDDEAKPIEKLYEAAVSFFVDMEQCDRFLLQYFTTINDIYPHYEAIFADVQLLFDELRSLRDFYLQFLASYQSVGAEMLRREQHDTRVLQFIEETTAKLAALEQEEIAMRSTFCEEHARFLPSTLCPEIQRLHHRALLRAGYSRLKRGRCRNTGSFQTLHLCHWNVERALDDVRTHQSSLSQCERVRSHPFMVNGIIKSAKPRMANFILSFISAPIASPPSSTDAIIRAEDITGRAVNGSATERSGNQATPSWEYSGKYFEMSCRPQKNPRKTGI